MKHQLVTVLILCLTSAVSAVGQTSILSTDFQSGIPVNYSIVDNDGFQPNPQVAEFTDAWIHMQDPEDELNYVAGSTSYFSPVGLASRWLITPLLELGAYGNSLTWMARSHDASFPDDYLVLVSTSTLDLESFTDTIGYVQEEYAEWTSRTVDLSSRGYDGLSIYVAFVNVTFDGFKLYLDNIEASKEDPASLSDIASIQLQIYPNPFMNEINLNCDCEIVSSEILELSGKSQLVSSSKVIQTEDLAPGAYLINITSDKGTFTRKLIKY